MLYDIGFFIFCILYVPALLFKGRLHRDFLQRFGIFDERTAFKLSSNGPKIWIQAVSVGEVALCRIFIPLLKERYPGHDIILSTITKAGNDLAKKSFSENAVAVIYFPLDFSFIVKRLVGLIKPKLYIMIETEIWPNLLRVLAANGIPSVLINGRISDRSFGKYELARFFLKAVLDKVSFFGMRSSTDADRIISLGAARDKVKITGNMKFDIASDRDTDRGKIKKSLGLKEDELLLVAGSTHKGEEEIVVRAYKELKTDFENLRLLIAPRHIDRVGEIEREIAKFGFKAVLVSSCIDTRYAPSDLGTVPTSMETQFSGQSLSRSNERRIFILDTIGKLNDIYSIATVVFIGGSLVKHGGHNPVEPALFEKAILFGPYMFNFMDTSRLFLDGKAAIQVIDANDLIRECADMLNDNGKMRLLGQSARAIVSENSGATERNIGMISHILK